MQKKEYYKHNLPHFQQAGQAYFVTWSLKDSVPKHRLKHFTNKLEILRSQIKSGLADSGLGLANSNLPLNESRIALRDRYAGIRDTHRTKLKNEYNLLRKRYIKAYNELLDAQQKPHIDLSKPEITEILMAAFKFWKDKRLKNHAFCIMPNHIHWVLELLEKDEGGNSVYLQDVLYSVKRFTANQINKLENRAGALWQKESFDTTIRDEKHLYYAIEYTLSNPVNAGLVNNWKEWVGCWSAE